MVIARDPVSDALAGFDEFSRQAVRAARPLEISVVDAPAVLDAIYRLRCRQVVDAGWAPATDFPDGRERDDYDRSALHIAALDGPRLVGTMRVVLPDDDRSLPTEEAFGVSIEPRGEVVDWGRLVVDRDHRGDGQHRVMAALLGTAWLQSRERGFHVIAGTASRRVLDIYTAMGFSYSVLGPSKEVWGRERFACRLVMTPPSSQHQSRIAR